MRTNLSGLGINLIRSIKKDDQSGNFTLTRTYAFAFWTSGSITSTPPLSTAPRNQYETYSAPIPML